MLPFFFRLNVTYLFWENTISIKADVNACHFRLLALNSVWICFLKCLLIILMILYLLSWTIDGSWWLFLWFFLDLLLRLVQKLTFIYGLNLLWILLVLTISSIMTDWLVLAAFSRGSTIVIFVYHYYVSIVTVVVWFVCSSDITIFGYIRVSLGTLFWTWIIIWFTLKLFRMTILLKNIWTTLEIFLSFHYLTVASVLISLCHVLSIANTLFSFFKILSNVWIHSILPIYYPIWEFCTFSRFKNFPVFHRSLRSINAYFIFVMLQIECLISSITNFFPLFLPI